MKYIHTGADFVAWFAGSSMSHSEIVFALDVQTNHAGFIEFGNPEKEQWWVFGTSHSLKLVSQDFLPPAEIWAGMQITSMSEYPILSSSKEFLEKLSCVDIQPAVWQFSKEPESSEYAPIFYLSIKDARYSARQINMR